LFRVDNAAQNIEKLQTPFQFYLIICIYFTADVQKCA